MSFLCGENGRELNQKTTFSVWNVIQDYVGVTKVYQMSPFVIRVSLGVNLELPRNNSSEWSQAYDSSLLQKVV